MERVTEMKTYESINAILYGVAADEISAEDGAQAVMDNKLSVQHATYCAICDIVDATGNMDGIFELLGASTDEKIRDAERADTGAPMMDLLRLLWALIPSEREKECTKHLAAWTGKMLALACEFPEEV